MPRPQNPRTETPSANNAIPASSVPEDSPSTLSLDQVQRWATRIADGRDEFPTELAKADHDRLEVEVRRQLRDRLVRLVARAIATNLYR